MDQSVIVARLTLMLLRASVPHPEKLPPDYQVLVLPSHKPVSQSEAVSEILRFSDNQAFTATTDGEVLVIASSEARGTDRQSLEIGATNFEEAIHGANRSNDPYALVRVVGFREEILVEENVIRKWLWSMVCRQCSMSFGLPLSNEQTPVIGVLYFGSSSGDDGSKRKPLQ